GEFKPDVVIAADDNAAKYIIAAYYKDAKLPLVFCGLNWDASVYGMPYTNVTGMVEVSLTNEIINNLRSYARGNRLAYLSADTETERKNEVYYKKILNLSFDKVYYAKTLEEWKQAFLKLQDEVDMIIIENNAGIPDWDDKAAEEFVLANVKVPAGTTNPWMVPFSLLGITKVAEEQGIWSAQTALKILGGTSPANIPLVTNKQGKFSLNMKVANKIGVVFKPALLKHAEILK
ncbi:MAG: ABC transporter substrate binding protein, partial [Candidatus Desantisbacteria bacterium]